MGSFFSSVFWAEKVSSSKGAIVIAWWPKMIDRLILKLSRTVVNRQFVAVVQYRPIKISEPFSWKKTYKVLLNGNKGVL